ncbi:ABC transporter permease [Mesorhizobium sp. 1B3]|uniref:ABC transporter permease n=1 Tax=Mesorhizobium sp. 1B3 TaxID=3243599 RepID=UPI003D967760
MVIYIARRLLIAILVAFTVSVISFSLLRASGDLAVILAGSNATQEDIEQVALEHGLDQPLFVQYLDWALDALRGNLGTSLFTSEPVMELIVDRLPVTLFLAVPALAIGLAVAIPLGVAAAVRPNSWVDRLALTIAVAGSAIPNFWLGLMLIYLFGVTLQWLPVSGGASVSAFVLPWITVATTVIPLQMRLTRTGMLEALGSDFVRTARAKGLHTSTVIFKHALRNAVLPIISVAAVSLGFLLSHSLVVEMIFALNGVGTLAHQSIMRVDFPVVQSITVFFALCYIVLTLLADIVNARLDPRISRG